MQNRRYLTPHEVAQLLMVSPVTVRQWAQRGLLDAVTTAGGHRRFSPEIVARFARERGIELPDVPAGRRRILIADGDRDFTGFLMELIRTQGGDCVEVASAHDGFEVGAQVHRFRPDVVVLDMTMPGMDGYEVCRELKRDPETASIRIVAMTAHHSGDDAQRGLRAGADRFLRKPFSNREVLHACGLLEERATARGRQER